MAPVGHIGNAFHGIPGTTSLSLPTLLDMPKLTATVSPLTPSQMINAYSGFPLDIPQRSSQPTPNFPAIFPTSLLMPCNFSFPTPQQLSLYALQMQNQQMQQRNQQVQQQSPTAINAPLMNSAMNVLMPMHAFAQQPFLVNLPLTATMPIVQTPTVSQVLQQQMMSKQDNTPPAADFSHSFFFNTPTTSHISPTLNLNNTLAIYQQKIASNNTFQSTNRQLSTMPGSSMQQNEHFSSQLTSSEHQISSLIRSDSPESNDPNIPPMLQPEFPCFSDFVGSEEFSGLSTLVPRDCFAFDDECGPPRLSPQIQSSKACRSKNMDCRPTLVSPPSVVVSPTTVVASNNHEYPFLTTQPNLEVMLMNCARIPSPKLNVQSPTVSTTVELVNLNGKRERSSSLDSPDIMLKMPKLIPMIEECRSVAEEEASEIATLVTENVDGFENTIPPALDSAETAEVSEDQLDTTTEKEKEEKERALKIKEATSEKHNISTASSSGVSSANSSLVDEEYLAVEFGRTKEKIEQEKSCSVNPSSIETILSPVPSPFMSLSNISLRSRHKKTEKKATPVKKSRTKSRQARLSSRRAKSRRNAKRSKQFRIQSDWRPVDEGKVLDVRLHNEAQSHKRRCYTAIQHKRETDEIIRVRDCIRVCSSEGLENIGKVLRLFLDESTGTICVQVLWYYTREQTPSDIILHDRELLASKHCDVINADAIEEHAFVLTYAEYCRFVAETRLDELLPHQRPLESSELCSRGDFHYGRRLRLPHEDSPVDLVYWASRTFSIKTRKICVSASRRGSKNSGRRHR